MACLLFSCKEEKKEKVLHHVTSTSVRDTAAAEPAVELKTHTAGVQAPESAISEQPEKDQDTADFAFDQFSSPGYTFTKKAKLDFASDEGAFLFRTRIREAYASGTPNFASYYITVIFGCGTSCIMGMMMDVRDGKIYGLPLGEETSCLFADERAIFNPKSRLFIASICRESAEAESVYYHAFVWNEQKKIFEKADEKDIRSL
ncbi:hypothetical protein DRF67_02590 [Chryseobacterium pennipullorum]|uniref:Uncharacterized protein n=2 Tax=Chryseobacterium pennipullorum TaxID=2258963 RepID=A0A3D9B7W5_9FLAO|nr:hypothetical protein DRF67_02590 [Chryseobacterium pennipullorum]